VGVSDVGTRSAFTIWKGAAIVLFELLISSTLFGPSTRTIQ
jgi:hypothetical protein